MLLQVGLSIIVENCWHIEGIQRGKSHIQLLEDVDVSLLDCRFLLLQRGLATRKKRNIQGIALQGVSLTRSPRRWRPGPLEWSSPRIRDYWEKLWTSFKKEVNDGCLWEEDRRNTELSIFSGHLPLLWSVIVRWKQENKWIKVLLVIETENVSIPEKFVLLWEKTKFFMRIILSINIDDFSKSNACNRRETETELQ